MFTTYIFQVQNTIDFTNVVEFDIIPWTFIVHRVFPAMFSSVYLYWILTLLHDAFIIKTKA